MSGFKTFAVAGGLGGDTPVSRGLGRSIVEELLKKGVQVKVLARGSSTSGASATELTAAGATIVSVDYADASTLEAALAGVDVVISALNGAGFAAQTPLADAAKKVGVKLFVPSEFGSKTDDVPSTSVLYGKQLVQKHLKEIDLPYTLIMNGGFAEFAGWFLQLGDGKAKVIGSGSEPISFTAGENVAQFTASILTNLPADELKWAIFPISGSEYAINDLIAVVEKKQGKKLEVTKYTLEEAQKEFKTTGDFYYAISLEQADGKGFLKGKRNDAAPEITWKSVVDFL